MSKNEDPTKLPQPAASSLAIIDDVEISPLSDEELDAVAGGFGDSTTVASCSCCAAGATRIGQGPVING